MLNFNRTDRVADPKDNAKTPLKPALYEPPPRTGAAPSGTAAATAGATHATAAPMREPAPAPERVVAETSPAPAAAPSTAASSAVSAPSAVDNAGSRLHVGVNIKLKGVEISDCDVLVIEGVVEATVNSKVMSVERPGSLTGTALIDVAEVHGEFSGELTARTRLVVHGTGRVRGTIRYGKLVVEEGGEVSGDVKRLDDGAGAGQGTARRA